MTARTISSVTCQNFCGSLRRKRAGSIVVKVKPALLTRICGVPNRSRAIATTRSQSDGRRRSATSARICPETLVPAVAASISATSASMWPTASTKCPSRARPNAIARPRPRNPPVTIATRRSIDPSLWYRTRSPVYRNSSEIRPNPRPPPLQETAHRPVGLQENRLGIGCVRLGRPTEAGQQIGARRPVGLIAGEPRVPRELIECREPFGGPRGLTQRHLAVDGDDGRAGEFEQSVIELEDGAPVGPAADPPRGVHRLHRRFELEPPDASMAARPLQQPFGLVDRCGIPQVGVLFGQRHVAAVGAAPCVPPGAGIKH